MRNKSIIIYELEAVKESFIEKCGAHPICIDEAIEIVRKYKELEEGYPLIQSSSDWNNYYVCSECRKPIDGFDSYCRHCGAVMIKRRSEK